VKLDRSVRPLLVLIAAGGIACGAFLDSRDITFASEDGGLETSTPSADGHDDGSGSDGAPQDAIGSNAEGGDGSSNCTANLETDPLNCGACGHSCLGGACTAHECQPTVLAQGQKQPWGIAVDTKADGFVYWGTNSDKPNDDAIMKIGKDGKNQVLLAHSPQGQVSTPRGITVDDKFVYWVNGRSDMFDPGRIAKCAISGCASAGTLLISDLDEPLDIVLDDTQMFWIEKTGARVARALKEDGGAPKTMTGGLWAVGPVEYTVAADATHVYFAARNTIARVAKTSAVADASTPAYQEIFIGVDTVGVAIDDTNVYWASEDDPGVVQYAPKGGIPNGSVASTLASQLPNPHAIAVDATNVYWINNGAGLNTFVDGSVMMCPKSGCAAAGPKTLAAKQQNPKDIAMDDLAIYWTVNGTAAADGFVMKVAKPL
jgi:hypothetical protein